MTAPRWSWALVLKELAGVQSALARADVAHRPQEGTEWHDTRVRLARLDLASVVRHVRALRRYSKAKTRRAA